MVNKRLHTVSDKSEVLVEDSLTSFSELLKSTLKREQVNSLKMKLNKSTISSQDQLTITFPNGSWTDKKTQKLELSINLFPTIWIPAWEKISKEWENARTTEVWDISGESESEVKELNLLVDAVKLSESRERSEQHLYICLYYRQAHLAFFSK